ncbi:helix-turn-helix transcriptional regulator [Frankia sp. QA3]|uniref:helix-turn-helix domain-containing protein n=1 Tax=Frankia sp. QA3 TaxID=710111 RepID=UPI000269C063|nr:helix-turn-helix transcriptional regulator [Frankia sp. QA3]EIV92488.1 hypothetical protein FraQA3DRAFT_2058 [Frankia sp. QA3]
MARQERPVDPAAGPLEAFASELRKVREDAGGPTYRLLARKAGYSASTLSEAAGGQRQPSLEVTLAYAGACGADVSVWRRRWYELDAALCGPRKTGSAPAAGSPAAIVGSATGTAPTGGSTAACADQTAVVSGSTVVTIDPATATPAGSGSPAEASEPVGSGAGADDPRPAPRGGRRPWRRRGVVAAMVALVVVAAVVVTATTGWSTRTAKGTRPLPAGAPSCPAIPAGSAFIGKTYPAGARVRAEPRADAQVLRILPGNCDTGFAGYCIGEKVYDRTAGTPDVRWFRVIGGGVTTSAMIHGNPPPAAPPQRCGGDRPGPVSLRLTVGPNSADPWTIDLQATGNTVDIVGFAISYTPDTRLSGARTWHHVDLVDSANSSFYATWTPAGLGTPTSRAQAAVVAVACLGGDSPTRVSDVRGVRWTPRSPIDRMPLSPADLSAASVSACHYPAGR